MQEHTIASLRKAIENLRGTNRIENMEALQALAKDLRALADVAEKLALCIAVENMP